MYFSTNTIEEHSKASMQSYLAEGVIIKNSVLSGKGIFAGRYIKKNEIIAIWGGVIYRRETINYLPDALQHFLLQIDENLFIGPPDMNSIDSAEYFNHSCNPNCGIWGQISLVAMRDIAVGEELVFDYAMSETQDQPFSCNCGSNLCRLKICGSDYLIPELQYKYDGYFSTWLEKKLSDPGVNSQFPSKFQSLGAWGLDTGLDLHNCDSKIIRDPEKIKLFTYELCDLIKVKRFGNPVIVHFGEDDRVAGYSLVQLIETSLISGHFANATNNAYINIFSCAYYNPKVVADFASKFFNAESHKIHTRLRH